MSTRLLRVNSLIKKELSQILSREVDFPQGVLVTVTRVETTSNLIEAKVYVSLLGEKQAENVFKILNNNIYHIQQILNKRLKMRPIPKIIFKKEEKTGEASKIEEILEGLTP
ncbi:MAG: 30S ribosome-binding factor RbfA [Candidatus Nealsonbacteria bacterium]|nr:30S ribosome-binding factor RbfA [Candidatus Nealsonbacteria bacterium]